MDGYLPHCTLVLILATRHLNGRHSRVPSGRRLSTDSHLSSRSCNLIHLALLLLCLSLYFTILKPLGCLGELHLYYGPLLAPSLCGFTFILPILPAINANCQDVQDRMVSDEPIKQRSTAKSLIAHLGRWTMDKYPGAKP